MRPLIIGESPSLQGDGRPFTGPSGDRLQRLVGVKTYSELQDLFEMKNIFDSPRSFWDAFDRSHARQIADRLISKEYQLGTNRDIILMGKKVMRAFRTLHQGWYAYEIRGASRVWNFPHPSGLSHYWNKPENIQIASDFLIGRVNAARTDHPSEHILPPLPNPEVR